MGIGYWNWPHFHIGNIHCWRVLLYLRGCGAGLYEPCWKRGFGVAGQAHGDAGRAGGGRLSRAARREAALKSYLDKQVKEGVITPAERKALGNAY